MTIIHSIVLFPLLSSIILVLFSNYFVRRIIQVIGIGSIFCTMVISFYMVLLFFNSSFQLHTEVFLPWICINNLTVNYSFLLDGLSLTMLVMVTSVGFIIHLFSSWYMKFKDDNSRFFIYMNLFVFSMITLVLADNLVFMYLGWEGVSLCSYLLVGFYYKKLNVGYSAMKGFIVTRIGDIFLLLAIIIIYKIFGTFNFIELQSILGSSSYVEHFKYLEFIAICLLLGSVGKSAQFPLHTWLVDAMVGPTPVSALIHAATMVTAGVYLIARMYFVFLLSPEILYVVGMIGSVTIIISCFCALVQTNIKRILAFSTMSQVGYMFLALSVHNWILAIKHLVIHSVFKTLLFLSTGSIITLLNNEQNIYKMGDLRKQIPFLYLSFLVGCASLASFPIITSGFYSKEEILFSIFNQGYSFFFICSLLGSFLTSMYTFRMFFLIFHRKRTIQLKVHNPKSVIHNFSLLILIILSTILGYLINYFLTINFSEIGINICPTCYFEIFCSVVSIISIILSYYLWIMNKNIISYLLSINLIKNLHSFFFNNWGFDFLYNFLFVRPYVDFSKRLTHTTTIAYINFFKYYCHNLNRKLFILHNGYLRSYILSIVIGSFSLLIIIIIFNLLFR